MLMKIYAIDKKFFKFLKGIIMNTEFPNTIWDWQHGAIDVKGFITFLLIDWVIKS